MDILEFEWDENKNKINIEKHGLSFTLAARVFFDEDAIKKLDKKHPTKQESRYKIVGEVGNKLISVVYTKRNKKIRIITARIADDDERSAYYD